MIITIKKFPWLSKKLYGEIIGFTDLKCENCNRRLFFSEKEREMKHKETIEIFRVLLAGSFSAFAGMTIFLGNNQSISNTGFGLPFLFFIFITTLLMILSTYNEALNKIRTDIRIIQALRRSKK